MYLLAYSFQQQQQQQQPNLIFKAMNLFLSVTLTISVDHRSSLVPFYNISSKSGPSVEPYLNYFHFKNSTVDAGHVFVLIPSTTEIITHNNNLNHG